MAVWATLRNRVLTDAVSTTNRACQFLAFVDEHLVTTAGWTRVGSGGGTASGLYGWGAAKVLPAFAASPGLMKTLAWGLYQNASGAQVLFSLSTAYCKIQLAPQGGFAAGASDEDTLPTAPAENLVLTTTTTYTNVGANLNQVFTFAYTADHNSFIFFGKFGAVDNLAYAIVKLEDYKTGDTRPYWAYCNARSDADNWSLLLMSSTPITDSMIGWHPTTGKQVYSILNPVTNSADVFLNMPVDPVSGYHQKLECLLGCTTAGSIHLRGKIPGVYRVSSALATGDKLSLSGGVYEQVVIGDYAVPWMSSDAMTW